MGSLANFSIVFGSSPAFNSTARALDVNGSWRVSNVSAHYNKAEYLLQLGLTFLDDLESRLRDGVNEESAIGIADREERIITALGLIKQSVSLDPANALGWVYLAKVQYFDNDFAAMRTSLKRSWLLAPNDLRLAPMRLSLVMKIHEAVGHSPADTETLSYGEIGWAKRDGAILNAKSPKKLELLMEQHGALRALLGDLEQYDTEMM